ncbi:hypothetical protein PRIPAC_83181 [Pristionchus pacificus]|uniref:Uncharacterized protein n=1 Tax=Pristionchus pacificus TaxID=54126 RepID=A0A454Y5M0_PRIPA|nr:hypothetical protein PRIPAC_83181 [Pristionchus pacificus]|eukprot:PDM68936.1 hypothetical protein PRIPAC_47238 [Pristionchus pacificus]
MLSKLNVLVSEPLIVWERGREEVGERRTVDLPPPPGLFLAPPSTQFVKVFEFPALAPGGPFAVGPQLP